MSDWLGPSGHCDAAVKVALAWHALLAGAALVLLLVVAGAALARFREVGE